MSASEGTAASAGTTGAPEVGAHDFARFQALIYRQAGIWLAPQKTALLAGRLGRRLRELGLASWGAYYRRVVEDGGGEMVRMMDAITTNETHFFREPAHFHLLEREVLPAWRAEADAGRRPRRVRAWSAGCSTGQEPYTLAMVLLEHLGSEWEVEVLGTDLSTRALERARAATWPVALAAEIPERYLRRWMLRGTGEREGTMKAGPELRSVVRFGRLNLNDDAWDLSDDFDLVFCRNVLIYFDADSRRRAVERLLERTAPDGLFFMGHAESLASVTRAARSVAPTVYARAAAPATAGAR
jgi:chemotaxis protein methyltransferase CheR